MLIIIVRPTVQPTTGHHHNNLATIRIGFPTVLYPTGNCDSLWITFRLLPRALSASVRLVVEHSWSGLWQRKVLVTLYEALASNLLFCNCDGSFLMEYSLLTSCWDVLQTFSCMPSEIVDDLWWDVHITGAGALLFTKHDDYCLRALARVTGGSLCAWGCQVISACLLMDSWFKRKQSALVCH